VVRPAGAERWSPVGGGPLMAAARDALRSANEAVDEVVEAWDVSPSPQGPLVAYLDHAQPDDETLAWLEAFDGHLAEAGFDGTLGLAVAQTELPAAVYARSGVPKPTAFVAYRLDEPFPAPGTAEWHLGWGVGPGPTTDVVRAALAWATRGGGPRAVPGPRPGPRVLVRRGGAGRRGTGRRAC
jgi:hypothetical protein